MKANELRIGNLVWVSSIHILDVYRSEEEINIYHLIGLAGLERRMVEIEPIPLTEKWFENFGAKRDDLEIDSYVLSSLTCDYRFFKSETIDGDIYWTCEKILGDTCIEYVHQIQNLYFALTGQELEFSE